MLFTEHHHRTGRYKYQQNIQVSFFTHTCILHVPLLHTCTTHTTWFNTFNHYCIYLPTNDHTHVEVCKSRITHRHSPVNIPLSTPLSGIIVTYVCTYMYGLHTDACTGSMHEQVQVALWACICLETVTIISYIPYVYARIFDCVSV